MSLLFFALTKEAAAKSWVERDALSSLAWNGYLENEISNHYP